MEHRMQPGQALRPRPTPRAASRPRLRPLSFWIACGLLGALPCAAVQAAGPAPAAPAADASASFLLREVRFSPTVAVSQADLQKAVRPFLGRQVASGDLVKISTAVRQLYEARGFGLMGMGFVSQDLHDGVLQVTIVEPRVTRVLVDSTGRAPVSEARAQAVLARNGIQDGQPLDLRQVDRAMFTLNDWPGVKARTTLTPGGDEGSYTVAVQTERGRAWDASVDADNHGTALSGRYRIGALLRWNNPLGVGDNLDLRAVASSGSGNTVGRLGYEIPVGPTPWRFGIGYSRVAYELSESFEGAVGTADVIDASLSYPIVRSRDTNLVGRVGLENKRLDDEFNGLNSEKRLQVATAGITFESRDTLGGGGFNGGSLGVQLGRLKDGPNIDVYTLGKFAKGSFQVTRLQAVTRKVSAFVGLSGQVASRNLDNAEKLTLGGARGVRAYPAAEGASDIGGLINAELRYWVNPQWTTYVFHDAARGKVRKTPTPTTSGSNTRNLHASGLGVQYTNPELLTVKATLGVRGDAPVLSDTDNSRTLLLVQVQHAF
jgi:hemolysin activation/secretion protein